MKRLKAFFYIYLKSLTRIDYYREIAQVSLKFSVKYYFALVTFALVITSVNFSFVYVPKTYNFAKTLLSELRDSYPDDLVITSFAGKWKINKDEPFFIKTPFVLQGRGVDVPENLIVFDHKGTINMVYEYDTYLLVNDVNILMLNAQGRIENSPLDDLPNGEIDKQKILNITQKIGTYLFVVPIATILVIFTAASAYYFVLRFFYVVFLSGILFLAGKIIRLKYPYSTFTRIGIHTLTLPITFELVFNILGIGLPFNMWFFGLNLIFGLAVVFFLASIEKINKPSLDNISQDGANTTRIPAQTDEESQETSHKKSSQE